MGETVKPAPNRREMRRLLVRYAGRHRRTVRQYDPQLWQLVRFAFGVRLPRSLRPRPSRPDTSISVSVVAV